MRDAAGVRRQARATRVAKRRAPATGRAASARPSLPSMGSGDSPFPTARRPGRPARNRDRKEKPAAPPASAGGILRGACGAWRLCPSVDVLLITALLLQLGHESDRLVGRACAVLRHDVDKRELDILGHVLGVAAHIEMRALGEPGPEVATDLAHAVLHVEF